MLAVPERNIVPLSGGEVVEGLDVLDRLSAQPVKQAEGFSHLPVETVWLKLVRRIR